MRPAKRRATIARISSAGAPETSARTSATVSAVVMGVALLVE